MGTTGTFNLGLIKPDKDESIKENLPTFAGWAAQNAANCDKIDSLLRMESFTYTLNLTGASGDPIFGAGGFTEAKCYRIFPRMVIVYFRIYAGATFFTTGTGIYRLNMPPSAPMDPAVAAFGGESLPIGKAILRDDNNSATSCLFTCLYVAPYVLMRATAGIVWTDAFPITFITSDRVTGYFMYPTAAA